MVIGVGVDIVDVERFSRMVSRTPGVLDRTLTADERVGAGGKPRTAESLAARFAAKEAVAKALGAPPGMAWHDCEVVSDEAGRPSLRVTGTVAERAARLGVGSWHLSISHDGGQAIAFVVASK